MTVAVLLTPLSNVVDTTECTERSPNTWPTWPSPHPFQPRFVTGCTKTGGRVWVGWPLCIEVGLLLCVGMDWPLCVWVGQTLCVWVSETLVYELDNPSVYKSTDIIRPPFPDSPLALTLLSDDLAVSLTLLNPSRHRRGYFSSLKKLHFVWEVIINNKFQYGWTALTKVFECQAQKFGVTMYVTNEHIADLSQAPEVHSCST
jgi:hypothetical protein